MYEFDPNEDPRATIYDAERGVSFDIFDIDGQMVALSSDGELITGLDALLIFAKGITGELRAVDR